LQVNRWYQGQDDKKEKERKKKKEKRRKNGTRLLASLDQGRPGRTTWTWSGIRAPFYSFDA
jgi:hypothetical protein